MQLMKTLIPSLLLSTALAALTPTTASAHKLGWHHNHGQHHRVIVVKPRAHRHTVVVHKRGHRHHHHRPGRAIAHIAADALWWNLAH